MIKQLLLVICITLLLNGCAEECEPCIELECQECICEKPEEGNLYIYFIDVGYGDSQLIKYGGTEMLIDCGKNTAGPDIVKFLKDKGVAELDYLMISHPDSDHLGGCDDVMESIPTKVAIMNGDKADTVSYDEVMQAISNKQVQLITAEAGDVWSIGPSFIGVVQANTGLGTPNKNSIVAKLSYGEMSVLFTGDCDRECEDSLLGKNIEADILKVAHHGSAFGTHADFLEKVNPQLAVISVGENEYGHPTEETIGRLNQDGIIMYRTDKDGIITVRMTEAGYEVVK